MRPNYDKNAVRHNRPIGVPKTITIHIIYRKTTIFPNVTERLRVKHIFPAPNPSVQIEASLRTGFTGVTQQNNYVSFTPSLYCNNNWSGRFKRDVFI